MTFETWGKKMEPAEHVKPVEHVKPEPEHVEHGVHLEHVKHFGLVAGMVVESANVIDNDDTENEKGRKDKSNS